MNIDQLEALRKEEIPKVSKNLDADDINLLIQTLNEKDDTLRYNAFLLLQSNSREYPNVYKYWGDLEKKLESPNSYQRSLGVMLIAENVRWDKDGKFSQTIGKYMNCCHDEKFITARQTIQGLQAILNSTDKFDKQIKQSLDNLRLSQLAQYKENQQKILTKDIAKILQIIEKKDKMQK